MRVARTSIGVPLITSTCSSSAIVHKRSHAEVNADATRLLLIRHAHIDTGKDGQRMCGWRDLPLSPLGEFQLKRFHDEFSEFKPQAVYASSSWRARSTAETLASNWNLDITIDPQLREINCGTLEGMSIEEVQHRYPELWAENALQENSPSEISRNEMK